MQRFRAILTTALALVFAFYPIAQLAGCAPTNNYVAAFKGPKFDVKTYGAKGDNSTNDAAAIQSAVDAAQVSGGTVVFPPGTYVINSAIALTSTPIAIEGASINDTVIKAGASITSVFAFADVSQNTRFGFKNLMVNGNTNAQYGIKSDKIDHALFYRVRIIGTSVAAFSTGYGWDNDFFEVEASSNTGDGMYFAVNNNNANNVVNSKLFGNNGWGINCSGGGAGFNVRGCTIEGNKKGGIYLQKGVNVGSIRDNYFEANAQDGYTMTLPAAKVIKAHIVVNGSATATELRFAFPCNAIDISNNYFINTYADEAIRINAMFGGKIHNNFHNTGSVAPEHLAAFWADDSLATANNLDFRSNANFTSECNFENMANWRPGQRTVLSTWKSDTVNLTNYITDDVNRWGITVAGGGGSIVRSSTKYNGFDVMDVTQSGGSSDIFGVTLDMSNYPELAGKVVYIAAYTKVSANTTGAVMYVNNIPSSASTSTNTGWILREMAATMPASGNVNFGIRKLVGTTETVSMTKPVVALVGAPFRDFYPRPVAPNWTKTSAPTVGTWAVGDIVWNRTPSAGSPSGWRCTSAGAPGTWESIAPSLATAQTFTEAQTITPATSGQFIGLKVSGSDAGAYPSIQVDRPGTARSATVRYSTAGTDDWYGGILYNGGAATTKWGLATTDHNLSSAKLSVEKTTGNVGFNLGATSPAAKIHIAAGTATAGTAPILLTAGTNTTAAVAGQIEYDGTDLFFTPGATRLAAAWKNFANTFTGDQTVNGSVVLGTAGNGVKIKTGSNATMGRAVLVGGTLVVSTTKATATANIILTTQVPGGTTGRPLVASRVNNTSFTIESRDGAGALQTLDTSTVAWVIFDEAP